MIRYDFAFILILSYIQTYVCSNEITSMINKMIMKNMKS